jgi:hypothetical protein
MLKIRPIVVNSDMVVLGGNMRLKACKEAGLKKIPIIIAADLSAEKQSEFIIKDNVGFGEWDYELLANGWDAEKLQDWGLDLPDFGSDSYEDEIKSGYENLFFLNIQLNDEAECQKLYEEFIKRGLNVKIVQ